MDVLRQLRGRAQAEVARHRLLEGRARPATILAPRRGPDPGKPDVVTAAPVAGDRTERREARVAAVRRDAEAVDAGAADDRDAPAALRPRAQDGEGVVSDAHVLRQLPFARG